MVGPTVVVCRLLCLPCGSPGTASGWPRDRWYRPVTEVDWRACLAGREARASGRVSSEWSRSWTHSWDLPVQGGANSGMAVEGGVRWCPALPSPHLPHASALMVCGHWALPPESDLQGELLWWVTKALPSPLLQTLA